MKFRLLLLSVTCVAVHAADTSEVVTFNKDVLPVLQKNCQSCHRPGEIAPMPLVTFQDVKPWAAAINLAVTSKSMPPWFADPHYGKFSNDPSLTSVHQPSFDMGYQAAQMLWKKIENKPAEGNHRFFPTRLEVKESCGFSTKNKKGGKK